MTVWNDVLTRYGMRVNIGKTKVMAVTRREVSLEVVIGHERVEQVVEYKYLGVNIRRVKESKSGKSTEE